MTWVLVLIGSLGPAILGEEFESQEQCLGAAAAHRAVMDARQVQAPMYCMGISEQPIPKMEVPGKWL